MKPLSKMDTPTLKSKLKFDDNCRENARKRLIDSDFELFSDDDFDIDCSDINITDELARGSYGIVYKGFMKSKVYAVKVEEFLAGEEQTNILVELSILKSLNHERLVKYHGCSYISKSIPVSAGAKVRESCYLQGVICY